MNPAHLLAWARPKCSDAAIVSRVYKLFSLLKIFGCLIFVVGPTHENILRWRCANLMRFITLQVALFSSNGIMYRHAPVCILLVYRYTSIIASFSHEVLANVEQRARLV